ncbi:MAG: D-alanyl-D-alanine carboxypeptidase [Oscillospiraceae bacterium]|nr:D-alanyl-D-alanine carboxypeptidase [Oscillospiraceae bacterium]
MKKLAFLLAMIISINLLTLVSSAEISCNAYILIEASTGRVLNEYNAHERLSPASLTKIMLLLLIAEEINAGRLSFDENVTVTESVYGVDGSVIWLEPGEVMSVNDLVKAVVISSANDAAVALAVHISGSEEKFAQEMNRKAHTLRIQNTNFVNVTGFDHPEHYTSAYDVAIMSSALMREGNYIHFAEFMLTRLDSVRTGTERETQLVNTNKLALYYKGVEGIKTGTTDNAGFCLSTSALRNDMRLISVVMGCKNEEGRVDLSEQLLDYGFENYELYRPDTKTEFDNVHLLDGLERELAVIEESNTSIVIPKGRGGSVKYEIYLPEKVTAPILKNQPVGTITGTLDGEVVYESYIVAAHNAPKMTFWKCFTNLIKDFFIF